MHDKAIAQRSQQPGGGRMPRAAVRASAPDLLRPNWAAVKLAVTAAELDAKV